MRTMRSANQFDEAMKNLTVPQQQIDQPLTSNTNNDHHHHHHQRTFNQIRSSSSALKLISQMNAITKSNSANNLLMSKESGISGMKLLMNQTNSGRKYSSSLDGDCILSSTSNRDYDSDEYKLMSNTTVVEQHHQHQQERRKSSTIERDHFYSIESSQNSSTNLNDIDRKPVAAPRMKKIGPTNVLSQQLSQLRRLYEAAEQYESDDSATKADEEVKHYLGNLATSEERTSELSGSWSRVKAKRTVAKQTYKDDDVLPDLGIVIYS